MKKLALLLFAVLALAIPARAQFSRITSVTLQNGAGTQAAFYTSPFTLKVGAACTWSVTGTTATFNCPSVATTPGGSTTQLQYNNAGAFGGVAGSAWDGTRLTLSNNSMATPTAFTGNYGDGKGASLILAEDITNDFNSYARCFGNASVPQNWCFYVNDTGGAEGGWLILSPLNAAGGMSIVGSSEATTFFSNNYSSNGADVADGGIFRVANAEAYCSEANPTGTDSCLFYSNTNVWTAGTLPIARVFYQGTKALATGAIASTACNIDTVSVTGLLTTDVIGANFNANVDAVTGYIPATTGGLRITVYPEADNIKISVCNPTALPITPGAVTLNLSVLVNR